uniref:Uncharacterized protein n=1 Tax=Anguilla anguilla TaxID=7936 RepID=A0A0E9TUW9_ANGAN
MSGTGSLVSLSEMTPFTIIYSVIYTLLYIS